MSQDKRLITMRLQPVGTGGMLCWVCDPIRSTRSGRGGSLIAAYRSAPGLQVRYSDCFWSPGGSRHKLQMHQYCLRVNMVVYSQIQQTRSNISIYLDS